MFVLNGIQTMSGYVYNLGNELTSMHGLVDMVRLSPMGQRDLRHARGLPRQRKRALRRWISPAIAIATATGNDCQDWCFRPDKPLTLLTTVLRF
ncbi:putative protease [Klebsiella pneumoniae]|uniref:Putative protease n=1 Tax=Klebsiella pneumoniae TaxID=573 RepID=A0A2X3F1M8_KLEPN|nr:putative protease [Klebsiella pneumoniae]